MVQLAQALNQAKGSVSVDYRVMNRSTRDASATPGRKGWDDVDNKKESIYPLLDLYLAYAKKHRAKIIAFGIVKMLVSAIAGYIIFYQERVTSVPHHRIFDCFTFNGEHDMLLFRLKVSGMRRFHRPGSCLTSQHVRLYHSFICPITHPSIQQQQMLDPVVDYFIIAESDKTFTERDKPMHFKANRHLYQAYANKIRHVYVDFDSRPHFAARTPWDNEHYSRNSLSQGLLHIEPIVRPEDYIILSDVDEIPDPSTLEILRKEENQTYVRVHALEMQFYMYSFEFLRDEVSRLR